MGKFANIASFQNHKILNYKKFKERKNIFKIIYKLIQSVIIIENFNKNNREFNTKIRVLGYIFKEFFLN